MIEHATASLAQQTDDILCKVLDVSQPHRIQIVRHLHDLDIETYTFDGIPIITFYAPEMVSTYDFATDSHTFNFSRPYFIHGSGPNSSDPE